MAGTGGNGGRMRAMEGAEDGGQIAEDSNTFINIYNILKKEPTTSFEELALEIGGGMSAQKISTSLDRIEKRLGKVLVERRPKSRNKSLTPAADEAYDRLVPALAALRSS